MFIQKAGTMNRREMLRLSLAAALMGTAMNPNEVQATQTVAAKPMSLPELPPKPPKDIAPKLLSGFVQTDVRTSGRASLFFTKATDHRCSFYMDIPRPTLRGTK